MLNEYSLNQILQKATALKELNLSEISVFKNKVTASKILKTIFACEIVQNNLEILVLLRNPNLDSSIFSEDCILKLNALNHLAIGGTPNNYIADIDYENSISKLIKNQKYRPLQMKVLRFEYCFLIGDSSIPPLLKAFGSTLQELTVIRNFYFGFAFISDMAFDLEEEFDKVSYDELAVQEDQT